MPVSRTHNNGPKCPENERGHKRPRSQLSNSSSGVPSPPSQNRPGSWPPIYLGGAQALASGPTINIPDTRYGYSSPRPPTRYSQVSRNHLVLPLYFLTFIRWDLTLIIVWLLLFAVVFAYRCSLEFVLFFPQAGQRGGSMHGLPSPVQTYGR